jgi:hypothetical protein
MLLSLSVQNKDYHFRQNPNATPLAGQNARIIYRDFSLVVECGLALWGQAERGALIP